MTYAVAQDLIGNKYISIEYYHAYGHDVYKVITATGRGADYREDKSVIYTDLKKATATYNRYRREARKENEA